LQGWAIGKAVALRAKVFGMRVIAFEPYPDEAFVANMRSAWCRWTACLPKPIMCPCICRCRPTRGGASAKKLFGLMKSTAFFINTARGPIVCEDELTKCSRIGKIAGPG